MVKIENCFLQLLISTIDNNCIKCNTPNIGFDLNPKKVSYVCRQLLITSMSLCLFDQNKKEVFITCYTFAKSLWLLLLNNSAPFLFFEIMYVFMVYINQVIIIPVINN